MKRFIQAFAFFILKDMIDERYVSRDVIKSYTEEMGKDWPVFEHTQVYFDQCSTFNQPSIINHRKEMKRRYKGVVTANKLLERVMKEVDLDFLETVEKTSLNPLVKQLILKIKNALKEVTDQ